MWTASAPPVARALARHCTPPHVASNAGPTALQRVPRKLPGVLTTTEKPLEIDGRFGGLGDLAHGGYVAGVIATELGAAGAAVHLKRPLPTGREITLDRVAPERLELRDGDALLAEAAPAELALQAPRPVTLAQAQAASERFPGFHDHPFPACFVCGHEHPDGLRIFPGPVTGRRLVAAAWVPSPALADGAGRLPDAFAWAALDCPQLWALMVHAPAA